MKTIAKHSAGRLLKGDAFQISTEAKLAKKSDPNVIDCTLGTFYDENFNFRSFPTIEKILNELPDDKFYDYAPTDGGSEFQQAVLNWVFENERTYIEEKMSVIVLPSPGGTGALSCSVFNSLDIGQTLLFPNLSWGPYLGIASNYGLKAEKFFLFANDSFNLTEFKEKADKIISEQGKLVVIINDPCNNPTGYTMTEDELQSLITYMNDQENIPCVLIYDTAYLDFAYEGRQKTREKFRSFTKANSNVLILVAFSASKTFSVYGQRLGALIILGKDLENVNEFYNASNYTARNSWSNCNKGLINMMITLDKDQNLKSEFLNELNEVVATIKIRSEIFLAEAKAVNLETYPYKSGFFVTMPVQNRDLALQLLKEKAKLYLLPFDGSVRIAICSIPTNDLKGLAAKIKAVI